MDYKVIYPNTFNARLSDSNEAESVFTNYLFSKKIQQFMLDYCFKIYSGVPLSDETVEDPDAKQ